MKTFTVEIPVCGHVLVIEFGRRDFGRRDFLDCRMKWGGDPEGWLAVGMEGDMPSEWFTTGLENRIEDLSGEESLGLWGVIAAMHDPDRPDRLLRERLSEMQDSVRSITGSIVDSCQQPTSNLS